MAAIERLLCALRWIGKLLAGTLAAHSASHAAVLPDDKGEAAYHVYDGGGVQATGPALLVRKRAGERLSLSAGYYVDAVSNASIDVVTTASPFKETRQAYDLGADWLVGDSVLSLGANMSREPDYEADTLNVDIASDVFGGMTTLAMGFSRGADKVGQKDRPGIFFDAARSWQYRVGVTQILTPRWLVSLNAEAVSNEGFLGSPYRAARAFGAFIPERLPRTRSSRAVKLRSIAEVLPRTALRVEWRSYWDNWDIKAQTFEIGGATHLGERWLLDASIRSHKQDKALFYADNAQVETAFVSRNRQLASFSNTGIGAKLSYRFAHPTAQRFGLQFTGSYERKQFKFADFTDLRSNRPYQYSANVVQLVLAGTF